MSVVEKSDSPKVARKQANKAASAAAELVERKGRAKENAELQSTDRTQSRRPCDAVVVEIEFARLVHRVRTAAEWWATACAGATTGLSATALS
jgi:hypothetical protein